MSDRYRYRGNIFRSSTTPVIPTALSATVISDTAIDLDCTATEALSYEISTNGTNYTEVGTTAKGTTTLHITEGLTAGTLYYFKVRAYLGAVYSEYSSVISVKTLGIAYSVIDTIDNSNYIIFSSLAQNPVNGKVVMTYLEGAVSGYGYDATKILKIKTSTNKGQTFGAASTAYDPGGILCVQEQHTGYDSNGRLHILVTNIDNATPGVCSLIYLYSDNDGTSFTVSDISSLVTDATYVIYRNSSKLIENSGVMLSVIYMQNNPATSWRKYCLRLVSGTWTKELIETTATNETEACIEVLSGNNLIVLTRDDSGDGTKGFVQYSSSDNGLNWTRLGTASITIHRHTGLPASMNSFILNNEKIIVLYMPVDDVPTRSPLYAIYAKASDLLNDGITGWNNDTMKILQYPTGTHLYIYHGSCLHYDNSYNAIGSWPSIITGYATTIVTTFNINSRDYLDIKNTLFPPTPLVPATGDDDADAFLIAANISDSTTNTAILDFVEGLKTDSLWSKIKALYPQVGGSSFSMKFNLVNPLNTDAAYRLHWQGNWIFSTTGAKPDGVGAYADTHLSPLNNLTLYSVGLGYYSRTNVSETKVDIGAGEDNGTQYKCLKLRVRYTDGKGRMYSYNGYSAADAAVGAVDNDSRGFTFGSRTANNVNKIYYRGSQSGTTNTTTTETTTTAYTLYIGADNFKGTAASFATKEAALVIITDGLDDTEAANLNTLVVAFQTTLGRNV
jgi:hypothetical protein